MVRDDETKIKESGFSSRYSTDANFILTKEFAELPIFSGKHSETVTTKVVNNHLNIEKFELTGSQLNRDDFLVLLSIIKIFDKASYTDKTEILEKEIMFTEIFDMMHVPKNQRKTVRKQQIESSLDRISTLRSKVKIKDKAQINFSVLPKYSFDLSVNSESFTLAIFSEFMSYFRESSETFLCHANIKLTANLSVDALKFYLYLTANKNHHYLHRSSIDNIFEFKRIEIHNKQEVIVFEAPEREVNRTLIRVMNELKSENVLEHYEIIKTKRKTTQLKFSAKK
ncbi:hypothetical protein RX914_10970 [Pseudomonas syringae pv. actinidiae]|nr:hypothetical protein [Pseudomonas syringae pv. actinidiae]MDU8256595.1 hypothetical protein [Pseudomonas syringae pv. actinidiae]MDU8261183.1 hypothetical protein [Pseudomonas syringae pv. actinidiae]MDU8294138.1 hypothetical protein [Pseudomonas syringae pv. actinidiae]MDU8310068.1 hypothetical protein [Pseudomonas syringae pv. actinidiae]